MQNLVPTVAPADYPQEGWFKAAASNDDGGGGCVEVNLTLARSKGLVGVRHSQNPSGPTIWFTEHEWTCFSDGMDKGEFNI